MNKYLLEMKNITKSFPGVMALDNVELKIKAGRVHALMGENGAGKSTLMKCLIGIHQPTNGEIYFKGEKVVIPNTYTAIMMGISMIHQELSPVLHRSIMENIWLGREPRKKSGFVDHKEMYVKTKELLDDLELDIDPKEKMVNLTVAKMQMIEIAKAVSYHSDLVIMDEPTSALTEKEVDHLFKIIRRLRDEGKAIIYISHKMDEIFEISDDITVLRDGSFVDSKEAKDLDTQKLITLMVGRQINEMFPKVVCEIGAVKMRVDNLSSNKVFRNVTFDLRKGEILGFAGLVGAGRTEVAEAIFGMRTKTSGNVYIDGKEVFINNPEDAIKNKIGLLTEDRRGTGVFPTLSISDNTIMARLKHYVSKVGLLDHKLIRKDCDEFKKAIRIKTPSLKQKIANLSGGNQQKVLVARWLLIQPEILILDEPTRGIDVAAKAEIHSIISNLANEGKSIIMISSELPEILGMSDRIVVMHEGEITGIVNRKEASQEKIIKLATGIIE